MYLAILMIKMFVNILITYLLHINMRLIKSKARNDFISRN